MIKIDKTLYNLRPTDENRLEKEMVTYDLLDKLNISYIRIDHDETATIEDCIEVEDLLGIQICKNLFLCNASKTDFYLLLMPGDKKFVTKNLSKQIGSSRLSFAGGEYMEKFLNITPGSVSILGLMNDKECKVKLLIDKEIVESEYFGCHPCINTSSLKIKISDILNKFLPYTGHDPLIVEL
ncbi:Ala-tRNA(Pro) deacylase [Sedimentibacter acidaminivorans]|jgi:Ala-tRNA(Pro) deacylase|uniref:Ala-tRNA(Pro) deacylase n=1 Tax=Sedimentibacter acidaminivorans TaxID=913099 RepID=A0ABS4GF94_9FIRM|nr:prolyl-tRNA synthetase associated domain-containing protein [Sedimentibacter acidaminivorans]MBP1926040.1 Ala-tRNA(Pro) deacylase [Sedimentibacter acidaminivorans]